MLPCELGAYLRILRELELGRRRFGCYFRSDVVVESDLGGFRIPLPERVVIGQGAGVSGIHRLEPQRGSALSAA